jgi:threonine dehydratase
VLAGNLILCEPTMAAREATAARVAAETGASFIPPYDYGPVIAGQGTIGLELLQQVHIGIDSMRYTALCQQ